MIGVIAAGGPETVAAGAAILRQGGNAVDAAVAAAFVSFIAEIGVSHLGGSGIASIYDPRLNEAVVYDFFSDTPAKPVAEVRRPNFEEVTIDFGPTTQSFHLGRASVAVPGNIPGLCRMAAEMGRLPLATLLQPAIELARSGVVLTPFQAETVELLAPLYTHTAEMRAIFVRDGRIVRAGDILRVPNLADLFEDLAREGEELVRRGRLARAIVADQEQQGGLLTGSDLEQFSVQRYPPIRLPYRGYEVLLPPPCSTGGVLTAFTMKLLAGFDVSRRAHGSADHLQLLHEAMAATSRARREWERMSDEMAAAAAIEHLLADSFVKPYRQEVTSRLGNQREAEGAVEEESGGNTTHISVIDGDGMTVSMTTTAGESAGYVVPGTGFIPNNILGEADLHPAGFHTRPARHRIPTMMTPAIVLQAGQPRLVVGSGGSIRIRSAILQVLSNLLDYRMTLVNAVERARVHVESGVLQCEAGYDPAAVDELEVRGYPVNRWQERSIYFGGAHSVSRTQDGRLVGAGDSRRGGATAVV